MLRKMVGTAVAASALCGGLAYASPAFAATCSLGANTPNSSVDGTGSRSGCSGSVTLKVLVKKDKSFSPDETVGSASRSGFTNGNLTAYGSCKGGGSYYAETQGSSGSKIQSGRVGRC